MILSKRNKLTKLCNSIHQGLPLTKRPVNESKHVMFIDQLSSNWSLELIHTISVNNRNSSDDNTKDKIITQSIINYKPSLNTDHAFKLVPKFRLNSNEDTLQKNNICLNSIEFYNHVRQFYITTLMNLILKISII